MAKFDLVHLRETWERLKVVSASLNRERDRFRESCARLAGCDMRNFSIEDLERWVVLGREVIMKQINPEPIPTDEEYQAAVLTVRAIIGGIRRACIELDAGPCPTCKHPMRAHSSAGCHWHKVVIEGDLYDSGEVCDCKQVPYSGGFE